MPTRFTRVGTVNLESSILTRAKGATNRKKHSVFSRGNIPWGNIPGWNVPGGIFQVGVYLEPKKTAAMQAVIGLADN